MHLNLNLEETKRTNDKGSHPAGVVLGVSLRRKYLGQNGGKGVENSWSESEN